MFYNKKKLIFSVIAITIIAIVAVFMFSKNGSVKNTDIKIGIILPLSGDYANVAEDVQTGVNLFAINHQETKFIIENDEGDTKKSISAKLKLASIDGVRNIIGPLGPVSSEAVYSSQVDSEKNNLFFVALSMCADQFQQYENMMCIYPSPYYQLKETYKYPKSIGKTSLYMITANDSFGDGLMKMTEKIAEEIGLKVIGSDKINTKDLEFRKVAQKAVEAKSDLIMVATMNLSSAIKIINSIKEKKYTGIIMAGADIEENTIKEFKNTFEGVYLSGRAKLDYSSEFLKEYKNKKGGEPNLYAAFGYVWSNILYELMKSNKQITSKTVMDYVDLESNNLAIKGMKYNRTDKTIKFPMDVVVIKNGQIEKVFSSTDE